MKDKVTIRGRVYDLNDVADLASIQDVLVSDNWTGSKKDGVNLFLSLQNMVAFQLKRHFAANFKMVMKTAMEEAKSAEETGSDGKAQVTLGFSFTVDMTAPTVATLAAHKLSFSVKHETKGKAQTHDINQGEFLDDQMGVVLDIKGFAEENSTPADPEVPADPGDGTGPAATAPKKKRSKKGKEAAAADNTETDS